jgi:hypothetical protein
LRGIFHSCLFRSKFSRRVTSWCSSSCIDYAHDSKRLGRSRNTELEQTGTMQCNSRGVHARAKRMAKLPPSRTM